MRFILHTSSGASTWARWQIRPNVHLKIFDFALVRHSRARRGPVRPNKSLLTIVRKVAPQRTHQLSRGTVRWLMRSEATLRDVDLRAKGRPGEEPIGVPHAAGTWLEALSSLQ